MDYGKQFKIFFVFCRGEDDAEVSLPRSADQLSVNEQRAECSFTSARESCRPESAADISFHDDCIKPPPVTVRELCLFTEFTRGCEPDNHE